jgi:hypothetical protein
MHRYRHVAIQFYTWLLRLYPAQFRAEFGDEMAEVFMAAVQDCRNGWGLAGLTISELRDLPFRVLQEHLAARQKRVLLSNTGVIMMESGLLLQIFRFFSRSLFVVLALFAVMVVLPFFALGLQSQTQMEVISGSLGPEAFPPYSGSANRLPGMAVLVLLAAPLWNAIFGVGVLVMLPLFWRRLSTRHRSVGLLAVVAAIVPTLFLFLPVGINLASWWMN